VTTVVSLAPFNQTYILFTCNICLRWVHVEFRVDSDLVLRCYLPPLVVKYGLYILASTNCDSLIRWNVTQWA
jgi:hypothetical protein